LLDAVSVAIRNRDMPRPERLPRLADFALWVEQAAPQLGWEPGAFLGAYRRMRADTSGALIEASPIAQHVLDFARDEKRWSGTADELLSRLNKIVEPSDRPRGWPGTARALGDSLRRMIPPALAAGVSLEFRRSNGVRLWSISAADSANSADSDEGEKRIGTDSVLPQPYKPVPSADSADTFHTFSVQTKEKENREEKESSVKNTPNNAALSALSAPKHNNNPGSALGLPDRLREINAARGEL
jgi:hypothetical protein